MKRPWLTLQSVITVTASLVLLYMLSLLLTLPGRWILGFGLAEMAAIIWMAIRILKDPYSTTETFDDFFYQDRDDLRRNGKE